MKYFHKFASESERNQWLEDGGTIDSMYTIDLTNKFNLQ